MVEAIRQWFKPPVFPDNPARTAQAQFLNTLILQLGGVVGITLLVVIPLFVLHKAEAAWLNGILLVGLLAGRALLRRGHYSAGVAVVVVLLWAVILGLTFLSAGPVNPALFYLAGILLIAFILLNNWLAQSLLLITGLAVAAEWVARSLGWMPRPLFVFTPLTGWLAFGLGLLFAFTTRTYLLSRFRAALALAAEQAATLQQTATHLHESEVRYASLFENNHAIMLLIDPATAAIVDANPAACAYYGWSRETMRTKRIDEINTLAPAQVAAEMALARSEQRQQFHFQHRRADGTVRDVEVYSGPLELAGRSLLYSIVHDISERKAAETALRDSERSYRGLFDSVGEAIYVVDQTGHLLDANRGAVAMYGFPREALLGQTAVFLAAPGRNDADQLQQAVQKAFAGAPQHLEFWGQRQSGAIFPQEIRLYPGVYFGRTVVIVIARDITERQQVTQDLEMLAQAGRDLTTTLKVDEIYRGLHEVIKRAMVCDFLFVSRYVVEDRLFWCDYGSGPAGQFDVQNFPPIPLEPEGRGTQSVVIHTGQPLMMNDGCISQTESTGVPSS